MVAIVGDGGFQMGGHELATAAQNGLHFVTLLVNDELLRRAPELPDGGLRPGDRGRGAGADFESMAAGYGVGYRRVTGAAEVGDALREAIAALGERGTLIELQAELAVPPQSL